MKKLLALLLAAVLLLGCTACKPVDYTETSFEAPESNDTLEPGVLTIKPRRVYWKDDTIVAQCYIHNGTADDICDITVSRLELRNRKGVIASTSFAVLDDVTMSAESTLVWRFVYHTDAISQPTADLSELTLDCEVSYGIQ